MLLAGVTDYSAQTFDPGQRSDPVRALAGAPDGILRILLAHQPRSSVAAAAAGFDLQLSGHTHGGQICLRPARKRLVEITAIVDPGRVQKSRERVGVAVGVVS